MIGLANITGNSHAHEFEDAACPAARIAQTALSLHTVLSKPRTGKTSVADRGKIFADDPEMRTPGRNRSVRPGAEYRADRT
jgi:hypothetical protein